MLCSNEMMREHGIFLSKKKRKVFGELKFMLFFWYIKQESYLASEKKLEGSFF